MIKWRVKPRLVRSGNESAECGCFGWDEKSLADGHAGIAIEDLKVKNMSGSAKAAARG